MDTDVILLVLGLAALAWSADRFIYGASGLASNLRVSPLIIGITVVGMGSSAPEMLVSIAASLRDNASTAVGNVLGSNITNVCLVLAVTALIKPLRIASSIINRELPLACVSAFFGVAVLWDNQLTFTEGVLLLIVAIIVIGYLLKSSLSSGTKETTDAFVKELAAEIPHVSLIKAVLWVLIGLIVLLISSYIIVGSAANIAKVMGISDLVIGLTVIAVGTSLPELAASIASIKKGSDDLVLGNIIGSNIFNILIVLAIPAMLAPGAIDSKALYRDVPYMLGVTLILLAIAISFRGKVRYINRSKGLLLLITFVSYQGLLVMTNYI